MHYIVHQSRRFVFLVFGVKLNCVVEEKQSNFGLAFPLPIPASKV